MNQTYDIWEDNDGDRHLLPSGFYRMCRHKHTYRLQIITSEGAEPGIIEVTKGKLLRAGIPLRNAIQHLLYTETTDEPNCT